MVMWYNRDICLLGCFNLLRDFCFLRLFIELSMISRIKTTSQQGDRYSPRIRWSKNANRRMVRHIVEDTYFVASINVVDEWSLAEVDSDVLPLPFQTDCRKELKILHITEGST